MVETVVPLGILISVLIAGYYFFRILMIALDRRLAWFVACLFCPIIIYVFSFMHWDDIEKPFVRAHVGLICAIGLLGVYMSQIDPASLPKPHMPTGR